MYLLYTDLDTTREWNQIKLKTKIEIESKIEIKYWIWQIKIEMYLQDKHIYIYTVYILEFIKLVTSWDEGIRTHHQQLYGELLSQ